VARNRPSEVPTLSESIILSEIQPKRSTVNLTSANQVTNSRYPCQLADLPTYFEKVILCGRKKIGASWHVWRTQVTVDFKWCIWHLCRHSEIRRMFPGSHHHMDGRAAPCRPATVPRIREALCCYKVMGTQSITQRLDLRRVHTPAAPLLIATSCPEGEFPCRLPAHYILHDSGSEVHTCRVEAPITDHLRDFGPDLEKYKVV
jgi:hypothetical protein